MALTTNPNIKPDQYNKVSGGYSSLLADSLFSDTNYLAAGDTVGSAYVVRAIVCSGAGNIRMQLAGTPDGTTMTVPLAAGTIYAYNPIRIYSTNTTVTGLYLLF